MEKEQIKEQIKELCKNLVKDNNWRETEKFLKSLVVYGRKKYLEPYIRKGLTDNRIHNETKISASVISKAGRDYWREQMEKKEN